MPVAVSSCGVMTLPTDRAASFACDPEPKQNPKGAMPSSAAPQSKLQLKNEAVALLAHSLLSMGGPPLAITASPGGASLATGAPQASLAQAKRLAAGPAAASPAAKPTVATAPTSHQKASYTSAAAQDRHNDSGSGSGSKRSPSCLPAPAASLTPAESSPMAQGQVSPLPPSHQGSAEQLSDQSATFTAASGSLARTQPSGRSQQLPGASAGTPASDTLDPSALSHAKQASVPYSASAAAASPASVQTPPSPLPGASAPSSSPAVTCLTDTANADIQTLSSAVAACKLGLSEQLQAAIATCVMVAHARDAEGRTCLHYAAGYGQEECVDILLAKGADPCMRDANGDVPLHFASIHGHPMCAYNIAKAAPSSCLVRNVRGQMPIDVAVACERGEVLNAMLLACAGDGSDFAVTAMSRLLRDGAVPDTWAPNGSSALMLAAAADGTSALKVLLEHGATIELQDALGRSALMFAAGNCAIHTLEALLDAGACIAQRDRRLRSVLDYAPEGSQVRTVLLRRLAALEAVAAQRQADLLAALESDDLLGPAGATGPKAATSASSAKNKKKAAKKAAKKSAAKAQAQAALLGTPAAATAMSVPVTEDGDKAGHPTDPDQNGAAAVSCATTKTSPAAGACLAMESAAAVGAPKPTLDEPAEPQVQLQTAAEAQSPALGLDAEGASVVTPAVAQAPEPCSPATCSACDDCQQTSLPLPEAPTLGSRNAPLPGDGAGVVSKAAVQGTAAAKQAAKAAAAFAVGAEAAGGLAEASKQASEPVGAAEVEQKGGEGAAAAAAPELGAADGARVGKEGQAQHQRELLLRWGLDALTEQDEEQDGAWQVVGGRPHRKATGGAPATPAGAYAAHAAHVAHAAAHHAHSAHMQSGHNWSSVGFARASAGKVGHSGRRSLDIAVAASTGASSPAPSSAASCAGSVVGLAPSAGKPQRTGSGHSLSSLGSCESAPAGLYAGTHHGHALHAVMHSGAGHEGLGPAGGMAGTAGAGGATGAAKGTAVVGPGAGAAPALNVWRRRLSMTEAPHGINAGPAPAATQAAAVPHPVPLPGAVPWGVMMTGGLDPAPAPAAAVSAGGVAAGVPDSSTLTGGHDAALAACSAAALPTSAAGPQPQQGKVVAPQGKAQPSHPAAQQQQHGGKPPPSSPGLPLTSNWASKSPAAGDRKAAAAAVSPAAAASSTPSTHAPTPPTHPSAKELQLTPGACDDQHDASAQVAPRAAPGLEAAAGLRAADAAVEEREAAEGGVHAGAAAGPTPLPEQGQAAAPSRKATLCQQEQVQEPPAVAPPSALPAQGHAAPAASVAQSQAIPAHLAAELARLRSEAKTLRSALSAATSGQQQQQQRQAQAEASGSWGGVSAASVSAAEAAAAAVAAAAAGSMGGSVSVLELERRLAERDTLHTANLAAVMQAAVIHAQEEAEKAVAAERLRFVTHMLSAGLSQDLVLSILNSMAPANGTSATLPPSGQLPQGSQGGASRRAYGLAPDGCGVQDREGSSPTRVPEAGAAKGRGARSRGQSSGAADAAAAASSGSAGAGRRSVEGAGGAGATQVLPTDQETSAQQSAAALGAHAAKTTAVSAVAAAAAAVAQACATGRGGGAPASTAAACASSGSGVATAAVAAAAASCAGAARGGPSGASASAAAADSDDDLLVAALSLAGTCSLRSPSAAIAAARASASSFYMPSRAPASVPMSLPPSLLRPSPLGLADWAADPSASACGMAASVSGPDSAITAAAALAGASMYSAFSSHHQAEGDVEGDSELPACGDISAMLDMSDEEDDPISLGILHSSCGAGPGALAAEAAAGDAAAATAGGSGAGTGDSARCPGTSGGTGGGAAAAQGAHSRPGGLSGGELVSGSLRNWLPAPSASQASSAAASEPVGIPLASPVGTLCGAEASALASGNSFSRCSSMALSGSPLHLTSLPGSSWGAVGSQGGSMCGGVAMAGHSLLSGAALPLPPTSLATGILGSTGAFTTGVGPLGKSLGRPAVGLAFGAVMGGALPPALGAGADLGCAAGAASKPALAQPWRVTAAAAAGAGAAGTLPPAPQPPRARQQQLQHSSNSWGSDELELPEFL